MPSTLLIEEPEVRMESRPASRFTGKRIHFIGIGGCGMSGLARMMLDAGAIVSGSDPGLNEQTLELAERGAVITREQCGELLSERIDLVVRTAAVPDSNPEYQAASRMRLKQIKYAEMLGQVMRERCGLAISGTHGKTTTTSMISYALVECGLDPSFVIGGTVAQLGGSSRSGMGDAMVVEACEFDRSFHRLHPAIAVITNIEEDHLDCYAGGIEEIVESFRTFARLVPLDGTVIANGQDDRVRQALEGVPRRIAWVGFDDAEALTWAVRPGSDRRGCYQAEVFHLGRPVAVLALSVPGKHNLFNATTAIAACQACGLEPAKAAAAISRFNGADRRMTEMGWRNPGEEAH